MGGQWPIYMELMEVLKNCNDKRNEIKTSKDQDKDRGID